MESDDPDELVDVGPVSDMDLFIDAAHRLSGQEPPKHYVKRSDVVRMYATELILDTIAIGTILGIYVGMGLYRGEISPAEVYKSFANGASAAISIPYAPADLPYPEIYRK